MTVVALVGILVLVGLGGSKNSAAQAQYFGGGVPNYGASPITGAGGGGGFPRQMMPNFGGGGAISPVGVGASPYLSGGGGAIVPSSPNMMMMMAGMPPSQFPTQNFPYGAPQQPNFGGRFAPPGLFGPQAMGAASPYGSEMSPPQSPISPISAYGSSPFLSVHNGFVRRSVQQQQQQQQQQQPFVEAPNSGAGGNYQVDPSVSANRIPEGPRRIIPPFLEGASQEVQDAFYSVVQDPALTYEQKQERLGAIVQDKLSEKQKKMYADFKTSTKDETDAKRAKIHKAVEAMSVDAQSIFAKVSAIMTNPGLEDAERWRRVEEIYNKLPTGVRAEFDRHFQGL